MNIFGGMKILWIIFGGSSQNCTIFRWPFLCILGSCLKVKIRNGGYFYGC